MRDQHPKDIPAARKLVTELGAACAMQTKRGVPGPYAVIVDMTSPIAGLFNAVHEGFDMRVIRMDDIAPGRWFLMPEDIVPFVMHGEG